MKGAAIQSVRPASPADDAGLAPGDVILEVNRHPVQSPDSFVSEVHSVPAGKDILLLVWSNGGASTALFIRRKTPRAACKQAAAGGPLARRGTERVALIAIFSTEWVPQVSILRIWDFLLPASASTTTISSAVESLSDKTFAPAAAERLP